MGSGASSTGVAVAKTRSTSSSTSDDVVYEVTSLISENLSTAEKVQQIPVRLVSHDTVYCSLPGALDSDDELDLSGAPKEQERHSSAVEALPASAPASETTGASRPDVEKRRTIITEPGACLKLYKIGKEVMPSTNSDMYVHYATRLKDGLGVVVKVRGKKGSFGSASQEAEWRDMTERLLNLPHCDGRCKYLDVFEDPHRYFVVMERCAGSDLYEYLERTGPLPPSECKEILRRTLDAVAELHSRGLIHKDLKLENVMVDATKLEDCFSPKVTPPMDRSVSDGFDVTAPSLVSGETGEMSPCVKLIDFDTVEEYTRCDPIRSRKVVGTDQYIAQEAYGGWYSPASDMFAVGVIAYRLLTGAFPFAHGLFDDEAGQNWVGSPQMEEIQKRLKTYRISYHQKVFREDPSARSFCEALLAPDERTRPSAVEALRHPFLAMSPSDEPVAHTTVQKGFFHLFWRH